ncbi:RPM1-interacting protein 4-like [Carica papaya]|uniref:RPM1-interacting protein 4-like n=1 Tax=Carica papaya TaxID=3649 RepID=UPI000B8CF87B|nr:RPM1-interacting protein 4-like [Carica papaya]
MASNGNGRSLPRFGEWDVNDPASAEGFTVIFSKARDDKRTGGVAANSVSQRKQDEKPLKKWLCFTIAS